MKQGTIKYSQEFISPTGLKRWVGIEMPVDFDTEDYLQVYENVASMVAICGTKQPNDLTGIPAQSAPTGEQLPTINREHQRLLDRIEDANTPEKIADLYKSAMNTGNDMVIAAYQLKHKQLTAPQ